MKILTPFLVLPRHRRLIFDLTRRELAARYKGSLLGVAWALLNPLLLLALYTFFFSLILKAKWGIDDAAPNFGLMLFCGLIVHGWMAEVLSRAPDLLSSNRNYVKKVVFPLEALSWITVLSALVQLIMSVVILAVLTLILGQGISWTILLLPVVLAPLLLLLLGLSWFISSLAVYFKDVGQFMGSLLTLLLFTSTAFFSLETAPSAIREFILFNPLTVIMDSVRQVVILHELPNWERLGIHAAISFAICILGYAWFQRTRPGFADVL
ncbi:MAG: ABC transporter permease [Oceanisphaera sp.]|uniref:ABC transporter permease n=1 Tax=Oceanisphaera sp. TaxID=1929979 RepID=UPI003C712A27